MGDEGGGGGGEGGGSGAVAEWYWLCDCGLGIVTCIVSNTGIQTLTVPVVSARLSRLPPVVSPPPPPLLSPCLSYQSFAVDWALQNQLSIYPVSGWLAKCLVLQTQRKTNLKSVMRVASAAC